MQNRTTFTAEQEIKLDLRHVSKIQIENWKDKALNNKDYFDAALKIGLTNEKPYCWRCSWIIFKVTAIDRNKIKPYITQIINSLDGLKFESQIAGFLKTLTYLKEIEEDYIGKLADYCIKQISKAELSSHVKFYSMQLLLFIAKKIPELAREFSLVIEENMPYYKKAYLRKYAKDYLKILAKL